jgi:hypothetical protein
VRSTILRRAAPSIDAVYCWADASDPAFAASLSERKRQYEAREGTGPEPDSIARNRFRSLDNLRYSLRSLEKNAPWFRKIYIVTNGQRPSWLSPDSRIEIVTTDDIFPDTQDLPSFNATAIEWHLHRIAGLGRYFVFMNDDYFFTRPTAPEFFFGLNGQSRLLLAPYRLDGAADGTAWERLMHNQIRVLDAAFGPRRWRQSAHGPFIYDQDALQRLRELWPAEIARTSSQPFRNPADLHMQFLYANGIAALEAHDFPLRRHSRTVLRHRQLRFIPVGSPGRSWQRMLERARLRPAQFLCLNDDCPLEDFAPVEKAHMAFLQEMFPAPSEHEAEPGVRPASAESS